MQKKYIFTLDKYYNDEEIAKVSPIIENFVDFFADLFHILKVNN